MILYPRRFNQSSLYISTTSLWTSKFSTTIFLSPDERRRTSKLASPFHASRFTLVSRLPVTVLVLKLRLVASYGSFGYTTRAVRLRRGSASAALSAFLSYETQRQLGPGRPTNNERKEDKAIADVIGSAGSARAFCIASGSGANPDSGDKVFRQAVFRSVDGIAADYLTGFNLPVNTKLIERVS